MSGVSDAICRDCDAALAPGEGRCGGCGSPRIVRHAELNGLAIAHIDCDAFYAAVEKRDRPELADRPVIVGGGQRGVVTTACYIARLYGVRSAMPMYKALAACPDAVVIRPDMRKYADAGRQVRALMRQVTPLVEPLSIDEAFLDLAGTERLHGMSPAGSLIRLARRIEREIGITVSIGLSYNKLLAKLASDRDKPRGFAVIGRAEARAFLAPKPVGLLWGVGRALEQRLLGDGVRTIGQLATLSEPVLAARYGSVGRRLGRFARGIDERAVEPPGAPKSISAETTLSRDLADAATLKRILWPLTERVAHSLKRHALAARTVVLKLKTSDFRLITRSRTLEVPTQRAERLFQTVEPLLDAACDGPLYRLIGIGTHEFAGATEADQPDLLDPTRARERGLDGALDALEAEHGAGVEAKGRGFGG